VKPKKKPQYEVHFICHSHDDVGWLVTPDMYYEQRVRKIITSVVNELGKDPKRRFSSTEIYFFQKWWNEQNATTKDQVRALVANGQLEFINGGWASSDEACPSYEELIDNILAGHAFLRSNFGIIPKHAWHLDAFGHSGATPELFARMGFETITFARMDEEERKQRVDNMNL
jgi:alpha-mannosidase